ncbi:MAG: uncharacterized protein H6Q00_3541 [Holophagaceae bacterium]|nr:uncharacterized protein [Holophagaceae bacterium]
MIPIQRAPLLTSYAEGHARLCAALAELPGEALDFRPDPKAWSIREIVFHLLEGEINWYARARFIMSEPGVTILPYDQDRWIGSLGVETHPMDEALELLGLLRKLLVRRLRSLPEEVWEQSILHPALGPLTLDRWLELFEPHLPAHLAQIDRNLTAWRQA